MKLQLFLLFSSFYVSVSAIPPVRAHGKRINRSRFSTDDETIHSDPRDIHNIKRFQTSDVVGNELIQHYISSKSQLFVVSVASASAAGLIFSFLMTFLFSERLTSVIFGIVMAFGIGCYGGGVFATLAQALGVIMLELLRRSPAATTISSRLMSQLLPVLQLGPRKAFPPCDNPWLYKPDGALVGVRFDMYHSLGSVAAVSLYLGWMISGYFSFIPRGLGAMSMACYMLYLSCLRGPAGDLARYIGHVMASMASMLVDISREVQLIDKLDALTATVREYVHRVNRKYRIASTIQSIIVLMYTLMNKLAESFRYEYIGARGAAVQMKLDGGPDDLF